MSACSGTRHGTASAAHNHGCTCPGAVAAEFRRRKRARLHGSLLAFTPSTGTVRRIRALQALGWPYRELAARLDTVVREVWRWTTYKQVRISTRDRVASLYEELSGTPGPSVVARRHAARVGWAVPLLWEGRDIDDPTARPHRDGQTKGPRIDLAEVQHLASAGLSLHEIATRLGVHVESIDRARQRVAAA